jgi:hypothetical protein
MVLKHRAKQAPIEPLAKIHLRFAQSQCSFAKTQSTKKPQEPVFALAA